MKKAQGLPISTIILAILGVTILVILFAMVTGKLGVFGRSIAECPGRCADSYTGTIAPDMSTLVTPCQPGFEKEIKGNYVEAGQSTNTPSAELKKCAQCCVAIS